MKVEMGGAAIATTDGHAGNKNLLITLEVIREGEATMVKPAEETEKGVYFLSNLDQNVGRATIKTVHLYQASPTKGAEEAVEVVRESLAKLLVPYHPMAGRLAVDQDGRLVVDLTGEGAAFAVAHADLDLGELVAAAPQQPPTLFKFLYEVEKGASVFEIPLMTVQVTKLKCGGLVVGICTNHSLADGLGSVELLHSWGHVARHGLPLPTPPFLDRSILRARDPPRVDFPHPEFLSLDDVSGCGALSDAEPFQHRAFVFDGDKIGRLKSKAAVEDGGPIKCTTFEVLSAFVWRAWSLAFKMSPHQQTKFLFILDGRSRFDPPLPECYFGNGIYYPCALSTAGELQGEPLSFGVKRVREAIRSTSDEYLRSGIDCIEEMGRDRCLAPFTATLVVTTWTRLAFHTMDFGWGGAVYSGPVGLLAKEVAMFLPHGADRKEISVYLGLPRSAMDTFERLVVEI